MKLTCTISAIFHLVVWECVSSELLSPDASLAYTWDRGYPQACQCIETGVTSAECSIYKCHCTCDLTAGSCDYNCCCDPDCSQFQVDRFENDNEICDFSGDVSDIEQLCYSSDELHKVNPRSPVGGSSTTANAVDELLCVSKVNREYKGDFYDTPAWRDSSVFQTSEGQKGFEYGDEIMTVKSDEIYDRNDTIHIYRNISGDMLSDGFLTLPAPDLSGYCNDNNYAHFQNAIDGQRCKRQLGGEPDGDAFERNCMTTLSSLTYASLLVATTPTDNLLSLTTVPATISTVIFQSDDSSPKDVTESWHANDCFTSYGNNITQSVNCQFSGDVIESSDFLCFNAVKSVSYHIVHDQSLSSAVTNVSVELVITNVAQSLAPYDLVQDFSISFANMPSSTAVSEENGNQVTRHRSGNPGYITGLPLLFGPVANDVVNMSEAGLAVPSLVSSYSTTGHEAQECLVGQNHLTTTVLFGEDILSGCTATLNRSSLRRFCNDNTRPTFLTATEGYIGYFGNADPLDISQWFALTAPPDGATWQWNDATSTCSSMTTGINYKFLVGYSGEKSNPQSQIISAVVDYTTKDVKMRVPASDETSEQAFFFSVSVTFVFKLNEDLRGYTPPPPPGLLTVPYDVFYPFIGNSASSLRGSISVYILVGVLGCCLYFA